MSFKKKKIRSDRIIKTHDTAHKVAKGTLTFLRTHFILILIIAVSFFGIGAAAAKITTVFRNFDAPSIKNILLSIVSSPLEEDELGHTNFLLLGIGGEEHDGGELTDSIIVASLSDDNDLVPMLSIPRDLYITDDESGYGDRINRYYELTKYNYELEDYEEEEAQTMALEETAAKIGEMLGIEIHYYALIDFNGFVEVIDAIGGIDIYLEESFYDNAYPIDGTEYYTTFSLPAGENHLDGEDALKYARSRHTTSDFDRALRQQEMLNAIKDKTFSLGVLGNPSKLKNLYEAVSDNFVTNMSFTEIAALGKMADDYSSDSMLSQVFNDTPWETAGFLYAPPRDLFNGAAVFLPSSGDYSEMQYFTDLLLYHPTINQEAISLQVVNASDYSGIATDTMNYLTRYGFNVERYGNAARIGEEQTTIFNLAGEELEGNEVFDLLLEMLPTAVIAEEIPEDYWPENWETDSKILIELGTDFIPYYQENYNDRFYYWVY